MTHRLVSIGDLVLDVVMPSGLPIRAGEHRHVDLLRADPGGAGNVMIAARKLGLDVSAIGTVGDDAFGAHMLAGLRAAGVETLGVAVPPGSATTVVVVLTDPQSGQHVFVGHRGAGDAIAATAETRAIVESADAVFVDGFALADTRTRELAFESMAAARDAGIPVYFDPGPMLPREDSALARRAARAADVVLLTAGEAGALLGADAPRYGDLLAGNTRLAVVKRAQDGCTIVGTNEALDVAGFPSDVLDTVGAGDCFDAAFIAAQLAGWSSGDAAALANAAGAASVRKIGAGSNAPTCAEINAVLAEAGLRLRYPCQG